MGGRFLSSHFILWYSMVLRWLKNMVWVCIWVYVWIWNLERKKYILYTIKCYLIKRYCILIENESLSLFVSWDKKIEIKKNLLCNRLFFSWEEIMWGFTLTGFLVEVISFHFARRCSNLRVNLLRIYIIFFLFVKDLMIIMFDELTFLTWDFRCDILKW